MKIEGRGGENFLLSPEGDETLKDIAISVIIASYELAHPIGYGFTRNYQTTLTREMAEKMLNGEDISKDYISNPHNKNEVYMDYVFGRCCKTLVYLLEGTNQVKVRISTRDREPKKIIKRAEELLKIG